jgi:hypothetical protein
MYLSLRKTLNVLRLFVGFWVKFSISFINGCLNLLVMVSDLYVTEGPLLEHEVVHSGRKVAFVFQGKGVFMPALDQVAQTLIDRGYEAILLFNQRGSSDLFERYTFSSSQVEGALTAFGLGPTDVLFMAFLGVPIIASEGRYRFIAASNEEYPLADFEQTLSGLACSAVTHYVSAPSCAGDVARRLAQLQHPEVLTHRVGIASHRPGETSDLGQHVLDNVRFSSPFDYGFFASNGAPSTALRLSSATQQQREYGPSSTRLHQGYAYSSLCLTRSAL